MAVCFGTKSMRRLRVPLTAIVAFAFVFAGCAAPPPPPVGEGEVPPARIVVLEGTVVDLDAQAGRLLVKEPDRRGTWTVAVQRGARIETDAAASVALEQVRIGDRLRVTGRSRIESILIADEILILGAGERQ